MKSKTLLVALFLVATVLLILPGVAAACDQECQRVEGAGSFCRQCVDTGVYTGITCESSGPCGCFFTQNTCGLAASGIHAQEQAADLTFLATTEAPVCQASEAGALAN